MKTRSCNGIAAKGLSHVCVWKGNVVNIYLFMNKPPRIWSRNKTSWSYWSVGGVITRTSQKDIRQVIIKGF